VSSTSAPKELKTVGTTLAFTMHIGLIRQFSLVNVTAIVVEIYVSN
jgi:hypothetical protein